MRTVLYIRVSTDMQAEEGFSIEAQRSRLVSFAQSQDWTIVDIYSDEGYSAKDLKRPEMKRMLDDMTENKFDVVLVYKLDRLTRSVADLHDLLNRFDAHKVKFKSATEVFETTTAMGRFFITLVGAMASWERETIAERVRFGVEQMVREGKRPGSVVPFGYTAEQEIVPEEAQLIRHIRDLYMGGLGYKSIAVQLNREGKLRRGSEWSQSTVAYTLENPYYAGIIRMGSKLPGGGYANGNRDDRVKCVYGEGSHEPIFTREEYDQHKNFMKRKSHNGFSRQKIYWFSGVLRCGRCGSSMFGRLTTKKSNRTGDTVRRPYYICSARHEGRSCDMPIFSQRHVEHLLMGYIEETRLNAATILQETEAIAQVAATTENEVDTLHKELTKIKDRKKKWQYMFVEGIIDSETVRERVKEETEKEEAVQRMIDELATLQETVPDFNRLLDFSELWDSLDDDDKKEMVYIVFSRLTLFTELSNVKGVKNKFFDARIEVEYN